MVEPLAEPTPDSMTEYYCLDCWRVPSNMGITALPDQSPETRARAKEAMEKEFELRSQGPFKEGALTEQAEISFWEEAAVVLTLATIMGGALWWPFFGVGISIFGSWSSVILYGVATVILSLHPLPDVTDTVAHSWIVRSIYKYFSYRLVYRGNTKQVLCSSDKPWIGTGLPHGVLPVSNLLSTVAVQSFVHFDKRPSAGEHTLENPLTLNDYPSFVGAPASVVFRTPFLRYFTLLKSTHVDAASLTNCLNAGDNVGLVGDGIAGIFQGNKGVESVAIKNRKGLAKLALRTGTPLVPCYSFGNTEAFSLYYDPYGWMEWLSRKAQASIFIYWGKLGLPIPHRVNITMAVGDPIFVEKVENPTQEQIDEVHQKLLDGVETIFNDFKPALGWGHKHMQFV